MVERHFVENSSGAQQVIVRVIDPRDDPPSSQSRQPASPGTGQRFNLRGATNRKNVSSLDRQRFALPADRDPSS